MSLPPHGTQTRYSRWACRCAACTAANTETTRWYREQPGVRDKLRLHHRNRYRTYADLCRDLGVSVQRNWGSHYARLRARLPAENITALKGERDPLKRWWLERYPLRELRELAFAFASGPDRSVADDSRAAALRRRPGRTDVAA